MTPKYFACLLRARRSERGCSFGRVSLGILYFLEYITSLVLLDRILAHFGIQDDDDSNDSNGVESVATALDCPVQVAPNFAGTGSPHIDQWLQKLEECALTVQWSLLQLFIYSEQLRQHCVGICC